MPIGFGVLSESQLIRRITTVTAPGADLRAVHHPAGQPAVGEAPMSARILVRKLVAVIVASAVALAAPR